jgi:hypothetical protein
MRFRKTFTIATAALAMASAGWGCTGDPVIAPTVVNNGASTVETFQGNLAVGGFAFYSFTSPVAGTISVTLLTLKEAGVDSAALVNVAIGVPRGQDCSASTSLTSAVSASPQVAGTFQPGIYCARVGDVGNLVNAATFSVNIQRPK